LCSLDAPSRVVAGVALPASAAAEAGFLVLATRRGMVKKTALRDLPGPSAQVLTLIKMAANDSLASAFITQGDEDVLMVTSQGMAIRFREREVRPMGMNAAGVLGIKLGRAEEQVVSVQPVLPRSDVLLVAQSGRAKRTPLAQYPVQGRHGVGALTWKMARKDALVGALVGDAETRFILAFNDGQGKLARLKDAPRRARLSAGGVLVKLKKGLSLQSVVAIATQRELRAPAAKKRRGKPAAHPPKKTATQATRPAASHTSTARPKNKSRPGRSARSKR
jgi:DNA gyrase subunit A